ncbi:hypothetical protein DPMN_071567 [Dreissena polymorpha]|uniref:Uncharacterized protein n=1 Tax=Dreissena polymorpha TaxID=45954 RepID=A0A9D3Z6X7_DREPO|nr:hypothetical protein DPMN_071567 [Dreissena polymorpha]
MFQQPDNCPSPLPGGKFHEDWTINLTFTVKTALPPGGHISLTKNVTSRVLTRKTATPPGTQFHEDWTINVTSKVLTRKTATTNGGHVFHSTGTIFQLGLKIHVFQPIGTIFELVQDIIRTNVLTKFHEDLTINLTSTVKTAPPPGGHVFLPTRIIFERVKDFIGTHTKNITSRVLTKENCHTPWHPGFSTTRSIFELVQDINGTHVLTKFHEDWTINVNVDAARQTTHKRRSQKLTMSTLCSG